MYLLTNNMDEVYFQYLHQLAIESPTFRKWRNLQNGEIYKYDRIEHLKPEDEDKLLKALRGASARHHRRQEKKAIPGGYVRVILSVTMACRNCPRLSSPPASLALTIWRCSRSSPRQCLTSRRPTAGRSPEAQEGARAELSETRTQLELAGERADRMDAEADERPAERDRLAAELGGGEGGALSPRRAR